MARQARGPPIAERENSDRGLVSAPTSAPLRTQPPPRPTGGSSKGGEVAAALQLVTALDERGLLADSVLTADAGFTARELAVDLRIRGAH